MQTRTVAGIIIGFAAVFGVALALLTPSLGVPIGVGISEGGSMGDPGPQLNVYADIEPSEGDVIIFKNGNPYVDEEWTSHRIVDENNGKYVTKGDANTKIDQRKGWHFDYANQENIAGVVLFRYPLWDIALYWTLITAFALPLSAGRLLKKSLPAGFD